MKTYIAKAEMCTYWKTQITATSQEEAEDKASELCSSEFTEIKGTGSWTVYHVEEVERTSLNQNDQELFEALGEALDWIAQLTADDSKEHQEQERWEHLRGIYTKHINAVGV